jgi:hypothetical protein
MTRRRLLCIIAIVVALPLLAVVAVWGFRDRIALALVRSQLGGILTVPADVRGIAISPNGDRITVTGVRIGEHHLDPADPLIAIDRIDLSWSPWALLDDRVDIAAVRIDGVAVLADRLSDGRVTLAGLLRPAPAATSPASVIPAIRVALTEITGVSVAFADAQAATTPWRATIDHTSLVVEDLRIDPGRPATARVRGTVSLRVAAPPGFAAGDLLVMPGASISGERMADRIRIGALVALAPSAILIRHADGRSNLDEAIDRLIAVAAAVTGPPATAAGHQALPPITLELSHVRVVDARLEIHDGVIADDTVGVRVEGIQLGVDDAWLHPLAGAPATTGRFRFDVRIHQPDPHPDAFLAVRGTVEPWSGGIPSATAALALTGFAFATVEALIPPVTRTAVGAEGFDLGAHVVLTTKTLQADGALVGDRGVVLPFRLAGTATAPVLAGSSLLLGAVNRLGGGVWNLGEDMVGGGIELVSGGAGAVWDLGSGVFSSGADLGGGLVRMVGGVITLDGEAVGAGARRATLGAAGSMGDGMVAAGGGVLGSGDGTLGALGGSRHRDPWRMAIPERHVAAVVRADRVLGGATVAITAP